MRHTQPVIPSPRGILKPEEAAQAFHLQIRQPSAELSPWIEYYWNVSWDLGSERFDSTVVTNPTIDLSFERDPATNGPGDQLVVTGVVPRSYVRHLTGRGEAFAAHFHPAQFRGWWGEGVQALTGRAVRLGTGPRGWETEALSLLPVLLEKGFDDRVRLLDELLLDHRPAPDPVADEIRSLVLATRHDRAVWSPLTLASRRALSPRSNQRQFLDYVGVGPKWVVMRHRIQAALGALDEARVGGLSLDLTTLALDLGYYDLSHFSREFKNLVGVSPDSYRT